MKSNILLVSFILLLLSGCSILQNKPQIMVPQASYLNAKWQIISVDNKSIDKLVNGKEPIFSFDLTKKEYSAITGCNNLIGGFQLISLNKIKFTQGMSTMMACDNMYLEQSLSKTLPLVSSYIIRDDTLTFLDSKKHIKALFKLKKEDKSSFLKGKWELDYIANTDKSFEELFSTKKPTIEFNITDETLVGNGGCNIYSGTYYVESHKLKFGAVASTKMACPSLGSENIYLKKLAKTSSFSINEDKLTLITDDIAILRFKKIK